MNTEHSRGADLFCIFLILLACAIAVIGSMQAGIYVCERTHEEWVGSPEHTARVMADEQERGLAALRAELKAHHEAMTAKWAEFDSLGDPVGIEPVREEEAE